MSTTTQYIRVAVSQHEPTWLDLGGAVEKTCAIIKDASEKGAKLVTFPECWIPARIIDSDTLEIACFPGRFYVHHYALVIATYLELVGKDSHVSHELNPDVTEGLALMASQLKGLGPVDTVVIGYVDRLDDYLDGTWTVGSSGAPFVFSWKTLASHNGSTVVLLGCMFSFWGDISVQLIEVLSQHAATSLIHAGKAAAVHEQDRPSALPVTGNESSVEAKGVIWDNLLKPTTYASSGVKEGQHITVPSPLVATSRWTSQIGALRADWVDCEVGLMAAECNVHKVGFAYLHFISDNLSRAGRWGL
ncbi:hypothetical protein MBLNU13_g04492t2 [Cladosporium sp. NU13]